MAKLKKSDIQACPVCGKTTKEVKSWVQCPEVDMPICMTHCFNSCNHLSKGAGAVRCSYRYKYLS